MNLTDLSTLMSSSTLLLRVTAMQNLNQQMLITWTLLPKVKVSLLVIMFRQRREISGILLFGKSQKKTSQLGNLHGDLVDQDGILSALQWLVRFSRATQLTFTLEDLILNSHITTMKSLNLRHTMTAIAGLTAGGTQDISTSMEQRCRNH